MEYSINKLSKMAGISTRTLRYYDEIGLLTPKRIRTNGYRIYGQSEVDRLQQILFYRELGVSLNEIQSIICAEKYDAISSLQSHLTALQQKKEQIDRLITNVEKTLASAKGDGTMKDTEKFDGLKKHMIEENEKNYGKEIREKYGKETVDASNEKIMGLSQEKYAEVMKMSEEINALLKQAVQEKDPAGKAARDACALHKKWLMSFWKTYSKEAHIGLANMYVEDPRFRKYYEDIVEGGAEFFRDAIVIFCRADV